MPTQDVKTWLRNRLQGKQIPPREVTDDALAKGYELSALLQARKELSITATVDEKGTTVWKLPDAPLEARPEPRVVRADEFAAEDAGAKKRGLVPKRPETATFSASSSLSSPKRNAGAAKRRTPEEDVRLAQKLIKRRAPTAARYLRQMAEVASADAKPCPACGRGMPRDEELRLKAVNGLLDRAGLSAAKAGTVGDDAGGPLIVFPPGTRIAVLAQVPGDGTEEGVSRSAAVEMTVTRGDLFRPAGQMPEKGPIVLQEERS
jgi:hypothetical protein